MLDSEWIFAVDEGDESIKEEDIWFIDHNAESIWEYGRGKYSKRRD